MLITKPQHSSCDFSISKGRGEGPGLLDTEAYLLRRGVAGNFIRPRWAIALALPDGADDFGRWLRGVLEDPLVKAMMRRCLLTRPQLETLLIDLFAEDLIGRKLGAEEKASLRLGKKVSRGSFNRTLKQARLNVIKAIYTVLLLGYIGVLGSTELEPYLELGSTLKRLSNALREGEMSEEAISALKEEVISKLVELSRSRALSGREH